QRFKAVNVERNVVVNDEQSTCARLPGIAYVGEHSVERVSMKVAAAHLDDGAETAIEGAPARGLDDVHLPPHHRVAVQHARAALWQAYFVALKAMHRTRRVLMPAVARAIRQALDSVASFAALQRAQ